MHGHLLPDIALTVVVATVLALIAKALKQPIVLAYIVAGVMVGPHFGPKLITDEKSVALISEIGLVLLLFMTGLEIELKELRHTSRSIVVTGLVQVGGTFLLGLVFFRLLGFHNNPKRFDLIYLAFAMSMSSTLITVKLLYDKVELNTLPGRISLGILLTQDVYAVLAKALQPSLGHISVAAVALSFARVGVLVFLGFGLARFVASVILRFVAKMPELILVVALAWCCVVCALSLQLGLSLEVGALVAGVSLASLPYYLEIIAKVVSIRDFFVLLFFASIGMQVPEPSPRLVAVTAGAATFVVLSRLMIVTPLLHWFRNGNRASVVPALNVAHVSEFSVVLAALGYQHYHHISKSVLSIIVFTFAMTSALSAYIITHNHQLFLVLDRMLRSLGVRDIDDGREGPTETAGETAPTIVLLGFFTVASSLLQELENMDEATRDRLLVVDFNPQMIAALRRRGVACVYGDIAHLETLQRAGLERAELIISTVPDVILLGTDNERILHNARGLAPDAQIIVTADSFAKALELYKRGADYVFLPRVLAAQHVASVIESALNGDLPTLRERGIEQIKAREEVLK